MRCKGKAYFLPREKYFSGREVSILKITVKVPSAQPLKPNAYDPFGSYSGVPVVPDETPVQDVDDL